MWLFQKPAVIVDAEQSRTSARFGSLTDALLPTAAIVSPWMSTTPSPMDSSVGLTWIVPPMRATGIAAVAIAPGSPVGGSRQAPRTQGFELELELQLDAEVLGPL